MAHRKPVSPAGSAVDRRHFIKRTVVASAGLPVALRLGAGEAAAAPSSVPAAASAVKATFPCGRLGKLQLSRLISGGNLLSGWCHQRDLLYVRNLATAYLTESKQFDTLMMLEQAGINAMVIDQVQLEIVNKYKRERGGKIQTIVGVRPGWGEWGNPRWESFQRGIREAIDQGADTVYVHGGFADRLVESGLPERVDLIARGLQFAREQGQAAGLGAHELEVLKVCDQRQIKPDYYVKTFHHDRYWSATPKERRKPFCVDGRRHLDHNEFHDNIFCLDPEATIEFMLDQQVPWIAFKVLAAGAIQPKSGFEYAFENGADFIAVGMFDFEVAEDVQVAAAVLKEVKRERPWRS